MAQKKTTKKVLRTKRQIDTAKRVAAKKKRVQIAGAKTASKTPGANRA